MAACGWMPPLGAFRSSTRAVVVPAVPARLHPDVRIATRMLSPRTAIVIRRMAFGSPSGVSYPTNALTYHIQRQIATALHALVDGVVGSLCLAPAGGGRR